jgi:hypothetical protein
MTPPEIHLAAKLFNRKVAPRRPAEKVKPKPGLPKLKRRQIGSKPKRNFMKAAMRKAVRDLVAQEDALWLKTVREELYKQHGIKP